jgi:hypothetical protein
MSPPTVTTLLGDYHAADHEQKHAADLDARRVAHAEVIRIGGEIAQHGVFVFSGDYHDLAQIIPFIDAYWTIYEEIKAADKYPYNADFEGRTPGLVGALPREETPIYMLQGLRSLVEGHERLAEVIDARYLRLTELAAPERFASIVVFDQFYRSQRYDDARLTPNDENRPSFCQRADALTVGE